MKVTLQNNYSYTYPVKKPVFQSASGDFGKAVGDVFQKETISETARNNLIDKLRPVSYTHLTLPTNREV